MFIRVEINPRLDHQISQEMKNVTLWFGLYALAPILHSFKKHFFVDLFERMGTKVGVSPVCGVYL